MARKLFQAMLFGFFALWLVSWESAQYDNPCNDNNVCPHNDFVTGWVVGLVEIFDKHEPAITAFSTIMLAVFTWRLWISTDRLWSAGEKQYGVAKQAADSADLSAKAAIAIELPIIRINPGSIGSSSSISSTGGPIEGYWIDHLIFSNLGRTKAFPVEIQIGFTVGNSLPESPIYKFSKPFLPNYIIEPAPNITPKMSIIEFDFEVSPELKIMVMKNEMNLWVYCNLIYLDFMQNRHEAGFCWLRHESMGTGSLRSDATPAYNKKT